MTLRFEQEVALTLNVNGSTQQITVDARETLLDVLRERLRLTGAKKGCNFGECGACTVHVDGRHVNACMVLAVQVSGRSVVTVEGVARGENLHRVQQAFIDCDAL